jgi:hypothetical protein
VVAHALAAGISWEWAFVGVTGSFGDPRVVGKVRSEVAVVTDAAVIERLVDGIQRIYYV